MKTSVLALVVLLLAGSCNTEASDARPDERSVEVAPQTVAYKKVFERLDAAADAGTDVDFKPRVSWRRWIKEFGAPRELRDLMMEWPGAAVHRLKLTYRYDDNRLVLLWHMELRIPEDGKEGWIIALKHLASTELKPTAGNELAVLKEQYEKRAKQTPPAVAFRRRSGDVREEVVADVQGGLLGSEDHRSSVDVFWAVYCPLELDPPTFAQLIAACAHLRTPDVPQRDEAVLQVLLDAPVFATHWHVGVSRELDGHTRFELTLAASSREKLEAELTQAGFKHRAPADLDGGRQQHFWRRRADGAHANIFTSKDLGRIRFRYYPPRRELQRTWRVDELTIENNADRELLVQLQRLAADKAGEGWLHQPLTNKSEYRFFTQWKSHDETRNRRWSITDFARPSDREEAHSIIIEAARNLSERGPYPINRVTLAAKWRPAGEGWGVNVRLRNHRQFGFTFNHFSEGQINSDQEVSITERDFHSRKTFGGTKYYVGVAGPASDQLGPWIASPRSLRDTALKQADALIAAVERGVRSGDAVQSATLIEEEAASRADDGRMFVYIPPPAPERQPRIPSDRPLTDEEKSEFIAEARQVLAARRALISENYEEMHAAILKAFPLDEFLEQSDPPDRQPAE